MADRPIIFSGPMVLALLAGRKTQTRRVIQPFSASPLPGAAVKPVPADVVVTRVRARLGGWMEGPAFRPRFAVGDRLWVREALQVDWMENFLTGERDTNAAVAYYQADDVEVLDPTGFNMAWIWERGTLPSIFMPRAFSRLTLAVAEVRIQRLHDITEDDARAEGITQHGRFFGVADADWDYASTESARAAYANLWESLNGPRGFGWDANPWVVALTFTVHHQNIDAPKAQEAA